MAEVVFVMVRSQVAQVYGGEKSTVTTAVGLGPHGYSARFLVTAKDDLSGLLDEKQIPYDIVDVSDPFTNLRRAFVTTKLRKLLDIGRVNVNVWRRARAGRATVVHAAAIPSFFCSWLGAKFAGARVIYHVRGASHNQRIRWFEELAILLADGTIAVSHSLREQLISTATRRLQAYVAPRIHVIYNGFDFAEMDTFIAAQDRETCRRAIGVPDDRFSVLFVGGLSYDKGQLRFIEGVLPDLVRRLPSVFVSFVGGVKDQGCADACLAAVQRHRLQDHVEFTGYLPQQGVYQRYRAADVVVLASESEGLPRCAIEAQAFSLPVVATDVVGTCEAIKHEETGYLVPPDQIERMVDQVVRLAAEPTLRQTLGAQGAAYVRSRFGFKQNVSAVAKFYRQLV